MRPTWTALGQTLAVSIATILGTGILGLPVSLYKSGLKPFLVTFTFNLIAQVGIVIALTELLQRAYFKPRPLPVALSRSPPRPTADAHSVLDKPPNAARRDFTALETDTSESLIDTQHVDEPPSLHSLSVLFIKHRIPRATFNFFVLFHFVCILSAYTLAAPQSYVTLVPALASAPHFLQTSVFLVTGATVVYLFTPAILPALSIATIAKAALLTLLVVVTLIRGLFMNHAITTNWSFPALIDPFLMGTLSLSGVANIMPVTFQTCLDSIRNPSTPSTRPVIDRAFVSSYRLASILAVVTCYILNVLWCTGVLLVVPQLSVQQASKLSPTGTENSATLQDAHNLGQISTVPLIQVLKASRDKLNVFVAILVNVFIAVSITISFLVLSVGTLHFLRGSVVSSTRQSSSRSLRFGVLGRYFATSLTILLIAMLNPSGLLSIMEGVTSLGLYFEAGLFVIYMLYTSRKDEEPGEEPPAPLTTTQTRLLIGFVGLYLSSCLVVDAVVYIPSLLT